MENHMMMIGWLIICQLIQCSMFNVSRFDPQLITEEIALRVIEKNPHTILSFSTNTEKMYMHAIKHGA